MNSEIKRRSFGLIVLLSCLFFFGAIPLVYFYPHLAANRFLSLTVFFLGLLVVAPTLVGLLVQVCRHGLRIARN